ncbi:MAG: HAMP domain-containing histidine kinase [Chloroflexota bacterium]|nr:HAMP domain-containing histidine kinase [Chloroflexota bacterium]
MAPPVTRRGGVPRAHPWRIVVLAVGGLLAAIVVAGAVMLGISLHVGSVADRALNNDVILEDDADDFRIAVLDLRHFQRNLYFGGPSQTGLHEFDSAYGRLLERIDALREVSFDLPGIAQPDELQTMAERYHSRIRPAMALYTTDRPGFDRAHEEGLADLASLDLAARDIDKLGEALAAAALRDVEQATDRAALIIILVIAGASAAGCVLAWAALRVLRELRELSARQEASRADLEAALRSTTAFIADASHELRTPLTVLRGNAEVGLALPSDGECGHEDVLREISREATRMSTLVDELLFLARADAGLVPLEMRELDLEPWLAEVGARAEMVARERGARLAPALSVVGNGRLDPGRLGQAVLALVDNAARAGPTDEPIRLSSRTDGQLLRIEIADRGPGIPEADLPLIFQRFHRADKSRRRRTGGSGLGLSVARAAVEAHGGRILAASDPAAGTVMTIELPIVSTAPAPGAAAPAPRPERGTVAASGLPAPRARVR